MFSRNFMRKFPIRKYADITARSGSISTDLWMHSTREIRVQRACLYLLGVGILLVAFDNFHTADELLGFSVRPSARTFYQLGIPSEVRYANESIIAGFEAIHKMRELHDTLAYEK